MRPVISLVLALLVTLALPLAHAQDLHAITQDGRKVILSADGTWKFDHAVSSTSAPADSTSASPYQPVVKKFSVAFDTSRWTLAPQHEGDSPNKRIFMNKTLPVYAMVISDEIAATTPTVREVILTNTKSAGVTPTILLEDSKMLGDKKVGVLRFTASMKGLDFVFTSNYYGDQDGNIQVFCYTGQSLFYKYEAECQKFIDGLSIK